MEGCSKRQSFLRACQRVELRVYSDFKKSVPKTPPWTADNVPWGSKKSGNKGFVKKVKGLVDRQKVSPKYEALGNLFTARDNYAR